MGRCATSAGSSPVVCRGSNPHSSATIFYMRKRKRTARTKCPDSSMVERQAYTLRKRQISVRWGFESLSGYHLTGHGQRGILGIEVFYYV